MYLLYIITLQKSTVIFKFSRTWLCETLTYETFIKDTLLLYFVNSLLCNALPYDTAAPVTRFVGYPAKPDARRHFGVSE